jgi:hypothetical protein
MATVAFNISKGMVAQLAKLPAANDGLVAVLLKSSGLEADGTLQDYDTLAAILAAANDEADFTGYARVALTGVAVAVDDTNNRVDVDFDDPVWSPTTAPNVGKIVVCYDPDTTTGTDADLIPIGADDFVLGSTPTSGTVTYQVAAGGFFRAS